MKYLKKFESNINYYKEIDIRDISLYDNNVYVLSKGHYATEEEKKIITHLIDSSEYRIEFNGKYHFQVPEFMSIIHPKEICDVYKLDDEWFIIVQKTPIVRVFKCDQMDGLIQCLKDNILK